MLLQLDLPIGLSAGLLPAHQLAVEGQPGTTRPSARRLLPLYYLHNYRRALENLEARYSGLLSADEWGFIRQFFNLPERSQCLLTRMLMRKGCHFRRATLQYAEVGDADSALQSLAELGWVDTDPVCTMEQLARIVSRAEWRSMFGCSARRAKIDPDAQLALTLESAPPSPRPMSQWHRRLTNSYIRLAIFPIAKRLQLLYFGNEWQTWAEFVLADLGVQRYEKVPYDCVPTFRSRDEIEHFYRLGDCLSRLDDDEPALSVLQCSWSPESVADWLHARFGRLKLRLAELLERQGDHDLAIKAYRDSATSEGRNNIVRLLERMGLHTAALDEATSALQLPCSESERNSMVRKLTRLRRRLGKPAAARAPRLEIAVLELSIPVVTGNERVERRVCSVLSTADCPAFYVENSLFSSLFGLLCWQAIFAPLPGAFFHPFQSGPADLFTPGFRLRRAPLLDAQLALLDSGQHGEVIWRHYRDKANLYAPFVRWGRLNPEVLALALTCIPPTHLRLIFERFLDDLENHCTGLPDLIHFMPDERRYRLVEVKAPGDRLQDNQRRWMDFFVENEIPAAVCNVKWTDATRPRPSQ